MYEGAVLSKARSRIRDALDTWLIIPLKLIWSRPLARVGLIILAIYVVFGLIGPYIWPFNWNAVNVSLQYLPPSKAHPLGTTVNGYDLLRAFANGTWPSIYTDLLFALMVTLTAYIMGCISALKGGLFDETLMRFVDIIIVLPSTALFLILQVIIPLKGLLVIIVILWLFSWEGYARSIRSAALSVAQNDFVKLSKAFGASNLYIIFHDLTPLIAPYLYSLFIGAMIGGIFAINGLIFLGFASASVITWGEILGWGPNGLIYKDPWALIEPLLVITIFIMALVFLNTASDVLFNPRIRVEKYGK